MSQALMAFRLGYHPYCFSIFRDLFAQMPEWEWGVGDSVVLALEELTEAVYSLASEIPTNVYTELRTCLTLQHERWRSIARIMFNYSEFDTPIDFGSVPDLPDLTPELTTITNQAIPPTSRYWPLYRFGLALGQYELALRNTEEKEPLPSLEAIVCAVRELPLSVIDRVPAARKMMKRSPKLEQLGPRYFLADVLQAVKKILPFEDWGEDGDRFVTSSYFQYFVSEIQQNLSDVKIEPDVPTPGLLGNVTLRPRWVKSYPKHKLMLGPKILREVSPKAINVIRVYDAFEAKNWRDRIEVSEDDRFRLHELIRAAKGDITEIEFHADGKGKGIT